MKVIGFRDFPILSLLMDSPLRVVVAPCGDAGPMPVLPTLTHLLVIPHTYCVSFSVSLELRNHLRLLEDQLGLQNKTGERVADLRPY